MRSSQKTAKGSFVPLMIGPHCLCNMLTHRQSAKLPNEQSDHWTGGIIWLGHVNEQWLTVPIGPWAVYYYTFDSVMPLPGQIAPPTTHTEPKQILKHFSDHNQLVTKSLCCFTVTSLHRILSNLSSIFSRVPINNCTLRVHHVVVK